MLCIKNAKHDCNIRNGFQKYPNKRKTWLEYKEWLPKCNLERKTWSEYKEWLPKMSLKKKNMVGKDKHGTNYERKTRVLY